MDLDSVRPIASGLAGGLIVVVAGRAIAGAQPPVRAGNVVLRHHRVLLVFFALLTAVCGALTVFNALGGNAVNSYSVAVGVPLFVTALGGYMTAEAAAVTVVLTRDTIQLTSPWREPREVPWNEVSGASLSFLFGWYALETRSHGTLRINALLVGSDQLRERLQSRGIDIL